MELFIPKAINEINSVLHNSGFQCYLVGGAIRNQLLGKEAKDYDLTTNAKPKEIMKLFKRVIPTGIKHGTVTILIGDDSFEITTYRIDGKYTDGRRPDKIQFTPSIEEDLLRRDFTINSLAYNVEDGTILDINRGIEDLNNRTIRAIGEPTKRFDEDALRLVRACRFASQLNFVIEIDTYNAMCKTLGKLGDVSKERISDELIKILKSSHPSIAFNHFYNCGMLKILFPTINKSVEKDSFNFKKALMDIDNVNSDHIYIKMARLLSITPDSGYLQILKNLKLSNDFIKNTIHISQFVNLNIDSLSTSYEIRKFISIVGKSYINDIFTLLKAMKAIDKDKLMTLIVNVENEIESGSAFSINDMDITGKDIIRDLKIKPGPQVGKILENLFEYVLKEPQLNTKTQLLEYAHKIFKS